MSADAAARGSALAWLVLLAACGGRSTPPAGGPAPEPLPIDSVEDDQTGTFGDLGLHARWWQPRVKLGGTYDEAWQEDRAQPVGIGADARGCGDCGELVARVEQDRAAMAQERIHTLDGGVAKQGLIRRDRPVQQREEGEFVVLDVDPDRIRGLDGRTFPQGAREPAEPRLAHCIDFGIARLADACRAFNTPVTGGNCSLYNQSPAGPIDPTPTVAMVGLIEDPAHITTQWFKDEGDAIILLGDAVEATPLQGLGGSAYLQVIHGKKNGSPPRCDLEVAKTLHTTLLGLIQSGLVKSAHDCSEGGLAVALGPLVDQVLAGRVRVVEVAAAQHDVELLALEQQAGVVTAG